MAGCPLEPGVYYLVSHISQEEGGEGESAVGPEPLGLCCPMLPHAASVVPPLSLASLTMGPQLAVQTKRVAAQVDGGAQVQQVLNIECLRDFLTPPLLSVRFR